MINLNIERRSRRRKKEEGIFRVQGWMINLRGERRD